MVNKVANYCSECGAKVEDSAIFCVSCGQKVEPLGTSGVESMSTMMTEYKVEIKHGQIKKSWIEAWLLIPSILAPFRIVQMISSGIAIYIGASEHERYSSGLFGDDYKESIDRYLTIKGVIGLIHMLYFIVATYYYFVENGLVFW
jgi:hypothetical protein